MHTHCPPPSFLRRPQWSLSVSGYRAPARAANASAPALAHAQGRARADGRTVVCAIPHSQARTAVSGQTEITGANDVADTNDGDAPSIDVRTGAHGI